METTLPHHDPNLYKFFIADENGTSQYLATLLEPQPLEQLNSFQNHLWGHWKKQLSAAGITLSSPGPTKVSVEYRAVDEKELERAPDIVIRWDDWFLSLENKTRAGSIRKGQLQEQYDALRSGRNGKRIDKHLHIGMIFLTPTADSGQQEFDHGLRVEDGDAKVHVSWHAVLAWIDQFSWEPTASSSVLSVAFRNLVTNGSACVHELLKPNGPPPPTPPYDALKTLVAQVSEKIDAGARTLSFARHETWPNSKEHFIWSTWKLKGVEGRSVNLLVYADALGEASQDQSRQRLSIHGSVAFYIERGAKSADKRVWSDSVHELAQSTTLTVIEKILPAGDGWEKLAWPERSATGNSGDVVSQAFRFDKDWNAEVDALASRVLAFLIAFRSVMYP